MTISKAQWALDSDRRPILAPPDRIASHRALQTKLRLKFESSSFEGVWYLDPWESILIESCSILTDCARYFIVLRAWFHILHGQRFLDIDCVKGVETKDQRSLRNVTGSRPGSTRNIRFLWWLFISRIATSF